MRDPTSPQTSALMSHYERGALRLPNRVVMAPMTRNRATPAHTPTPIMATYYAQRATAGLIITEGVAPVADGCGYARIPGLWSDEQVAAWRVVTEAVHAAGGRVAAQLMHTGRVSHPANMPEGARALGPTARAAAGEIYTDAAGMQPHPAPLAMGERELEETAAGFARACERAMEAGFDAVELHGANGYLLE